MNDDTGPDDHELVELLDKACLYHAKAGNYELATLLHSAANRLNAALDARDDFESRLISAANDVAGGRD